MPRKEFERAIVWFRRDLRVSDHAALLEACMAADEVIPLFIVDETVLSRPDSGAARVLFLLDALKVLDKNLQKVGGRLILRNGKTPDALLSAVSEMKSSAVYFHTEYEPSGRDRDLKAIKELEKAGIVVRSMPSLCLSEPGSLMSQSGKPYTVFTPYKKVWLENPVPSSLKAPENIKVPKDIHTLAFPTATSLGVGTEQKFECGGEDRASQLLHKFADKKVSDYGLARDLLAEDGTSLLSRHLHLGTVTPAAVVDAVRNKSGAGVFLSEIAWRDFYFQILFHFPRVENEAFRENLNGIRWENDETLFDAWCEGRTGYPIVDAAMRQLNSEAWMHNRARMIVASFLTKDLLINWQWGERYFMSKLVDGDLAANNGGWQWSAGTGTDAQPFFRIFNPTNQGEKFDTDGKYVKKYVPELNKLPSSVIHSPWKLSPSEQEYFGCVLGRDYPFPIVDHKAQRLRALSLYRAAGDNN